jgi:hypothetical protein
MKRIALSLFAVALLTAPALAGSAVVSDKAMVVAEGVEIGAGGVRVVGDRDRDRVVGERDRDRDLRRHHRDRDVVVIKHRRHHEHDGERAHD